MQENREDKSSKLMNLTLTALMAMKVTGCGSPDSGSGSQNSTEAISVNSEVQALLENQVVKCSSKDECSESIVQIVVAGSGGNKLCTGFLVGSDVVATSANCLSDTLRVNGASCKDKLYFIFPEKSDKKGEVIGCSDVKGTTNSPEASITTRGGDIAFVRMSSPTVRAPFRFSMKGIGDKEELHLLKISSQKKFVSMISGQKCTASHNSYAQPLANTRDASVIPVVGCDFQYGNEGAPLINQNGDVVGIFGEPLSQAIVDYLGQNNFLTDESKPVVLVSNMACSPKTSGVSVSASCSRNITESDLFIARNAMLNDLSQHVNSFNSVKTELKNETGTVKDRFINWKVDFIKQAPGINEIFVAPDCFNRYQDWINRLHLPVIFWELKPDHTFEQTITNWKVETKFDELLKPISTLVRDKVKKYTVKFYPSKLAQDKESDVEVTDGFFSKIYRSIRNSNDTGACQ